MAVRFSALGRNPNNWFIRTSKSLKVHCTMHMCYCNVLKGALTGTTSGLNFSGSLIIIIDVMNHFKAVIEVFLN